MDSVPQVQMQMGNERTNPSEVSSHVIKLELLAEGAPGVRGGRDQGAHLCFCCDAVPSDEVPRRGGQWPARKKGVSKGMGVERRLAQGQSITRQRFKGQVGKCLDRARPQARDNEWLRMGPRDVPELIQLSGKRQDDVSHRGEVIYEILESF